MRWLCVALLCHATTARADATVEITLNDLGREIARELELSVPELIAHAESRIDELYRVSRIDHLLRSFANTAAFAQRGIGADYDVDPGDIMIGAATSGVHGDIAIGTTNWAAGSVVNFAAVAGVNLARWQYPRITAFAGGSYETTALYGLKGSLKTIGAHAQYQLVLPTKPARARWTGVAVTTGLEYARWTVGTEGSLESHFTAEGPGGHRTVHMSSTGTLDVLTSTFTVPLEVTTGARLLSVWSVYTGGGLSLSTGSSSVVAELDSLLTINADRDPIGNALITGDGASSPSALNVHALAGTAIHTRYVRVFLQGAFTSDELSVTLGVRVVP